MLHLVARVAFSLHVGAPVTLHFVTMEGHWHQKVVLTYPDLLSRCLYLIGVKPWALCCQNFGKVVVMSLVLCLSAKLVIWIAPVYREGNLLSHLVFIVKHCML
jgi:hypothetical protein